jgi:hypothetical protein
MATSVRNAAIESLGIFPSNPFPDLSVITLFILFFDLKQKLDLLPQTPGA